MAVFHAFRALRPTPEKAADVAALPYDGKPGRSKINRR